VNTYTVTDLPVAAYLAYKKVRIAYPFDSNRRAWTFDDDAGVCEQYELDVRNGDALVSVSDYEATRKNVLGMVHSVKAKN